MEGQSGLSELSWVSAVQGCPAGFHCTFENVPDLSHKLQTVVSSDKYEVYMWQSRAEIEGYSVAYFDRIAAFETSYR